MADIPGPNPKELANIWNADAIPDDRPCLKCGYNLKGLPRGGVCPECGVEMGPSLEGLGPAGWSPGYVRRLRWGATLTVWGLGLAITAGIVESWFAGAASGRLYMRYIGLFALLWYGAFVLAAAGLWLLASGPHSERARAESAEARGFLRAGSAGLLVSATGVCAYFGQVMLPLDGPWWAILWLVSLVVTYASVLVYLRILGRWANDRRLGRGAVRLMWSGPALIAGSWAALWWWKKDQERIGGSLLGEPVHQWVGLMLLLAGPVLVCFLCARLLHRLRQSLRGFLSFRRMPAAAGNPELLRPDDPARTHHRPDS